MWKKVVAPVVLVSLLWLVVSGATTYYIHWLSDSHTRILTENVASIRAAGVMQEALWKLQAVFLDVVEDDAPDRGDFQEFEARFERSLVTAEQTAKTVKERTLVGSIRTRFSEYQDLIHRGLARDPLARAQAGAVADRSTQMARRVAEPCTELLQLNERLMTESVAHRTGLENMLNLARLAFLVAGPAVGIYVGLRIARSLHHSISQISVTLKDASGELDHEVGSVEFSPVADSGDLPDLNRQVQAISTRIRQVLVELQKARHEAELSERLAVVGELAAGVAHELRNPLTSVKLLIQTAPADNLGIHLQERQSHVILQEILRMEETIQGLLDFARPPQLNRVRHDLRDTVRRALNLVEGRAIHEEVALISRLPADPLIVNADPEQLHQVFVNLLINGIESMQHSGTLDVTAGLSARDGRTCQVVVGDRGGGIPQERLTRIFEPFITTKERGTGLGLAVSQRIVREHGGTITATNRPEGGAVFTVELPLAPLTTPTSAPQNPESFRPVQASGVAGANQFT